MSGFHSDDSEDRTHRDIELSYPLISELIYPSASAGIEKQSRQDIELSFPLFAELTRPATLTLSPRIPVACRIEQSTFDDVHRRCYIDSVPPPRG
jgi:hypothetical protein